MNRPIVLALFFGCLSLACGDSADSGGKCRDGEPIACTCDDGRSGAGICGEDACDCPPTYLLVAEPASLEFGEVARGGTRDAVLLLRTSAPGEVRLKAVELVEDAAGAFALPDPLPVAIPAGGSVPLTVRFEPRAVGSAVARIRIEVDDLDVAPVEVLATGSSSEAPACDVEVVPGRIRDSGIPGTELVREIVLRNLHPAAPCTVSRIRLCENTDPAYSLTGAPPDPVVIQGGGEFRIALRFAPEWNSCGEESTDGCIEFDLAPSPEGHRTVPLSCEIVEPDVHLLPHELDFGTLFIGCGNRQRWGELINLGSGAVHFESAVLGPETGGEFVLTEVPPSGTPIAAGFSRRVVVDYRPVDEGVDVGEVLIRLRERSEPLRISLRGRSEWPEPTRDSHVQGVTPRLDVLVVIDNGTSMAGEAPRILKEMGVYPEAVLAQGIDARFAVTTTGLVAGGPGCPGGVNGGEDGRFFPVDGSRPRILEATTPGLGAMWQDNLVVGSCHNTPPQGLEAALRALTPPLSTSADDPRHPEPADGNEGFFRPGASLNLILISDRADASPGTDEAYYLAFMALVGGPKNAHRFHLVAITGDRGTGCSAGDRSAVAGDRLLDFADRVGGVGVSICDVNWAGSYMPGSIGIGPRDCFYLSGTPSDVDGVPGPDGLRVLVNGVEVPATVDGEVRWSYDPTGIAVCFVPEHRPAERAEITIEYVSMYCH